jgi:hydroxyacylglutathione hydrolase
MPRIPIEDTFTDVIAKAQRGLGISDKELCELAEVSPEDLRAVKSGQLLDAVIRRVARHLKLGPNALEELAHKRWYPEVPVFPHGFAIFNAPFEDRLQMLFITHAHDDHVADLERIVRETGAEVWASEREAPGLPGAKVFTENAHFHIGGIAIKTLATWGHSPGQTTFYVTGLSYPLAIVGDSLFASSIGGSPTHFADQYRNDVEKILTLPRNTVLACGHGPLTTVSQEKRHNPFFAP